MHDIVLYCIIYYLLTLDTFSYIIQLHREFKSLMSRAETVTSLMDGWPEWKQRLIYTIQVWYKPYRFGYTVLCI